MLKISTAPHLNSPLSTRGIMLNVILALLPALIAGLLFFGLSALLVVMTSVAGCVVFEYLIERYMMNIPNAGTDMSAVVTGLLLAFNLPAGFPIWMNLIGCFVAIGVAKMAYGGIGKNLFNPALVGRVFLFISFPVQMTCWIIPEKMNFMNLDAQTGATPLGILKHLDDTVLPEDFPVWTDMFFGYTGGCIGETSALALLLGLAYLLWKKIITPEIPFYYISSFFILVGIHWLLTGDVRLDPLSHILSGGLLLGAIFMATDYTTSPMTRQGKILFGIGCGALSYIIRIYGIYPEGVSFAILIMNAFVPLIDMICIPRIFGIRER